MPSERTQRGLAGSPIKTHFGNTLNLILPLVEIFMVRVLKRLAPEVRDPTLAAQVRGFTTQESSHSAAHAIFFRNLEQQGYRIERFLGWSERFFDRLDRILGPRLSISTVACAEHHTAMFAEIVLEHDILREADPHMRALFEWHAAEEIEHRTVAFDLFQAVDGRYWMRCLGAALGTAIGVGFLTWGILMLTRFHPSQRDIDHLAARILNAPR